MSRPTSQNRLLFKNYLRTNKVGFSEEILSCNFVDIKPLLINYNNSIQDADEIEVVIFDDGENINFTDKLSTGTLFYIPAQPQDKLSVGIGSTSFDITFDDDELGITYEGTSYTLNDQIILGDIPFNILGVGGVLLETLDELQPPVYSVGVSTTIFKEGQEITFTITAENVASGTELYYTITGDVNSADFTDNTLSGSFTVIDFGSGIPTGTVTKNISVDLVEEGDEDFIFEVRTDSTSGTIVATSSTITIQDSNPTFTITPTSSSINEGESVTFNVTATDIPTEIQLFFTTIGNVTASDFSDNSLSGSFSILNFGGPNSIGAFTRNTVFDFASDQNKNFQIELRINSTSGSIVGTSSTVIIKNIAATFNIEASSTNINEGESVTFTISTNVPDGTILYYTTLGDVSANDFSDNVLSGSTTVSNQTATIVKTTVKDRKTEGDEQFAIQLRLDSVTGNIVATSSFVTIKDTSRNVGENANGLTFGPVQINRDNGNPQLVSDWYKICNIDSLPEGSKIALFIDTSGSMTQSTIQASYDLLLSKLAEKNISVITVTNPNEDWITPFLTELD